MASAPHELFQRAVDGDQEAFAELLQPFRSGIEGTIRRHLKETRLGSVDVDDLSQETALRAFESLPGFEWTEAKSFGSWLFVIARNQAGMALRRVQRSPERSQHEVLDGPSPHEDLGGQPLQKMRREERFDRLRAAFAELPDHYREALTLSRIEGLSVADVAKRMDRSVGATSVLLLRALRKLGDVFGDTESLGLPPGDLSTPEDEEDLP